MKDVEKTITTNATQLKSLKEDFRSAGPPSTAGVPQLADTVACPCRILCMWARYRRIGVPEEETQAPWYARTSVAPLQWTLAP